MNLKIQPYNKTDKERLVEIFHLNTPKYFDPKEIDDLEEYLEIMSNTYLTVELDNKIVGSFGYEIRESDKSGRINWIFFHPDFSGIGLGRRSVEHCLALFKSYPAVEKYVVRTTQLVYPFFEKCGYKLIQTEKNYWAQGFDLYLMERKP